MIPWLSAENLNFPSPDTALTSPNGLLAAGGCLNTQMLLKAYQCGIFPWYHSDEPILWWSPEPRLVLKSADFHTSRNLRKTIRSKQWTVVLNNDFSAVIAACRQYRTNRQETWITDAMVQAYQTLHNANFAHSVSVLDDEQNLIGGLYGVAIGSMFFGESMVSLVSNASKVALFYLCRHLQTHGFPLLDCQVYSDHLMRLGATSIPRRQFLAHIAELCSLTPPGNPWRKQDISSSTLYVQ